jgi:hypothetical protein
LLCQRIRQIEIETDGLAVLDEFERREGGGQPSGDLTGGDQGLRPGHSRDQQQRGGQKEADHRIAPHRDTGATSCRRYIRTRNSRAVALDRQSVSSAG